MTRFVMLRAARRKPPSLRSSTPPRGGRHCGGSYYRHCPSIQNGGRAHYQTAMLRADCRAAKAKVCSSLLEPGRSRSHLAARAATKLPLILRSLPSVAKAGVSKDGRACDARPPISGLPEIGIIDCASRQQPTCSSEHPTLRDDGRSLHHQRDLAEVLVRLHVRLRGNGFGERKSLVDRERELAGDDRVPQV